MKWRRVMSAARGLAGGSARPRAATDVGLQDAGPELVRAILAQADGRLVAGAVRAARGVGAVRPVAAVAARRVQLADHLRQAGVVVAVEVVVGADVAGLLGPLPLLLVSLEHRRLDDLAAGG